MRVGTNPNVKASVDGWGDVIVSAITHLPELNGYHATRLDVVRASLETMRKNAGADCKTLIWDNGSCKELTDWLVNVYKPDYLFLSPNMGKATARANIINMLPDNTIIAMADDDIFYHPYWLRAQIELLKHFPNVGEVSGYPVRTQFGWGNHNTISWAKKNATLDLGRFIPEEWDKDFAISIGRPYETHLKLQAEGTVNSMDIRITYKGVKAYAVAHHCQWVGYAGVIRPFCKRSSQAMRTEREFDDAVDNEGLLRLTTIERYSQHIGNVMDDKLEVLWRKYCMV
jgi:glycosyltransferase involved in cell wall biosynthesis